jgi:hypothetical protein
LEILPTPQRNLWQELKDIPSEFTLYGGTAVALHLGHRQSIDFDFFGRNKFNPLELVEKLSFLGNAQITQSEPSTLTMTADRGGPIKLSFFGMPRIHPLIEPHVSQDNNLKVASLLDLAGMKVSVVQSRAELKDYLNIDAILASGKIDLPTALAAGMAIYGSTFNPESTLKALCYFEDGNVNELPQETRKRLVEAVKKVKLDKLPVIKGGNP